MKVKIELLPDGRLPTQATDGACGLDCYAAAAIELTSWPALVSLGFKLALPPGYGALLLPRSGLARTAGLQLTNSPGLIDSDYRGEVSALCHVIGNNRYQVTPGTRICQLVILPIPAIQWQQVQQVPDTLRGDGGFGSTGVGA